MCILRVCVLRVCALLLVTTALLMLPHWGAGVNRNACVHAVCDHCAANVAALGGRSKPERLCAFCVCALLLVTTALLMLRHWGAGVNGNACLHFTCVRLACVHCCL